MKIKIAISTSFLLLFAIAGPLRAQYASSWWGVRAGVNIASENITTPDNATINMKVGALGGLAYEHWFDDTWGFNASILFDQKGASEVYATSANNREVPLGNGNLSQPYSGNDNFTLNYLEVPLVLQFSFGEGNIVPYIAAGPAFGFLLSASESTTGQIAPVPNLKSYLQTVDVSIYGGLGLEDEIYHGPTITFDAGYAAGLTKVYKSSPTRFATDGKAFPAPIDPTTAKSSDIEITLGIMWPIGTNNGGTL